MNAHEATQPSTISNPYKCSDLQLWEARESPATTHLLSRTAPPTPPPPTHTLLSAASPDLDGEDKGYDGTDHKGNSTAENTEDQGANREVEVVRCPGGHWGHNRRRARRRLVHHHHILQEDTSD